MAQSSPPRHQESRSCGKGRHGAGRVQTRLKIDSAKDKARVEALKRVSQAVYGTTKADWRTVIADSDIFDADDKRFLDLDDYDEDDEFA